MSFTGSPASASAFRVPPVAISSTPYFVTQFAGEVDEAGLVGDAEQRTADRTEHRVELRRSVQRENSGCSTLATWPVLDRAI